jgi:hypothetical protein
LARATLRRQLAAQVHPDGVSFEGSTSYHRLAVELATLAHVCAPEVLGGELTGRLHAMYRVADAYCSPSGRAPQIGDNDSGCALPLVERASLDHGYLAPLGAALFDDAALKHSGTAPDEVAWLFGREGVARFSALRLTPGPGPFTSPAGGLHVLRSPEAVVTVSAGPLGQRRTGGHNHNDQLGFELHVRGVPTLVDPGSPTYGRSAAVRNAYRATRMHATWELDGREQAPLDSDRLFALADRTRTQVLDWNVSHDSQRLSAIHDAYAPWTSGGRVRRAWELLPAAKALRVEDELTGQGAHSASLRLHAPHCEVALQPLDAADARRLSALGEASEGGRPVVQLGRTDAGSARVVAPAGCAVRLESFGYSPGYGEIVPGMRAVFEWTGHLPVRWVWWVLF